LEQEYSNSHLSVKIIKEIEIFYYWLTLEQKSSIEQLIPNPELRERYLKNGLCKECRQPKISYNWCQPCSAQHFRENFKNWTSGNKEIDKFIQRYQLEAISKHGVLEWISYKRLKNVEYLAKGGFGKVYKAEWIDSDISHWGEENKKWMRGGYFRQVALKSLNNSQNVTTDFYEKSLVINCLAYFMMIILLHAIESRNIR